MGSSPTICINHELKVFILKMSKKSKLINQIISHINKDGGYVELYHCYWSRHKRHLSKLINRNRRKISLYTVNDDIFALCYYGPSETEEFKLFLNSLFKDIKFVQDNNFIDYYFKDSSELESWLKSIKLQDFNIEFRK